ncbi:hypothetical protein KUCAC02_035534 [Chaenocephalus aceratus]|nr:hypothetical protein KUCAC02_035534 [Chaenocephalus aceratus]
MQWSLFVLLLMGQCSFSTCHLYEYHFIKEGKTWEKPGVTADSISVDLATMSDMRDVKRLTKLFTDYRRLDWTEEHHERDIKEWHWSLPGEKYYPTECDQDVNQNGFQKSRTMEG